MAASRFKEAKDIKNIILNIPLGPQITDADTGASHYLGEVIPTTIEPNNIILTDATGTLSPGFSKAQDAIRFIEATLIPFEKDLDYVLKRNKASPEYQFLKKMVSAYGTKP